MRTCVAEYPYIRSLVDPNNPEARALPGMAALREHAVELASRSILDDMREFHRVQSELEPQQARQVKEQLHRRLRRLAPGGTSTLRALKVTVPGDGPNAPEREEVSTDPAKIAAELVAHWGRVFGEAPIDEQALQVWLGEALPPQESRPPHNAATWAVRKKDVARAVRCAGNSMPGPDRIPYLAWRKLGRLGIDVLFDAAAAMAKPDFPARIREAYRLSEGEDHPFNLGILVCIPKKVVEEHPEHGPVFTAGGTRPLSIVDTANRILANAYRYRWEPPLAAWVSPEQRGFLPGRSILANVVDVGETAAEFSLTEDDPVIFLFDFAAAFPSVHQTFLVAALQRVGLPMAAITVVRSLYDSCRCTLCLAGERWPGFSQRVGIRQGCPLSPLLFAVVVDLFIRKLKAEDLGITVRAYADDIAIVARSIRNSAPRLRELFNDLAQVSNLALNVPKTVCIPLWCDTPEATRHTVSGVCPEWRDMEVSDTGRYLGFYVGPGRKDKAWAAAGDKMLARATTWEWPKLGLFYATMAYNTYIASLACYVAQLDTPPPSFRAVEERALRRAAAGPYKWAMPEDLFRLRDVWGQAANFRDLHKTALAAKVRVATFENNAHGGLHVATRARRLRDLFSNAVLGPHRDRRRIWQDWYDRNPLLVLNQALQITSAMDCSPLRIMTIIAGDTPRPWPQTVLRRIKTRFQSALTAKLKEAMLYDAEGHMRRKLRRWNLPNRPHVSAARAVRRLQSLPRLVPPRVAAAVLSTIWNRWATARRLQIEGPANRCVLGCSPTAEDSLEHYACCPLIRQAARRHLRLNLRGWPHAISDFMMLQGPPTARHPDDEAIARHSLLLYAAYRVTNDARHRRPATRAEVAGMLQQAIGEGTRGHPGAAAVLRRVWHNPPAPGAHGQPP